MGVQMSRRISLKPYQRRFQTPLRTAWGEWTIREGFILRVEEDGRVGFGEVAPIPDFGTETVDAAGAFLEELVLEPDLAVPADFPCCTFGLSAAARDACPQASAQSRGRLRAAVPTKDYEVSALLPAGSAVHAIAAQKMASGYRCLKWKIGVESLKVELEHAAQLFRSLPTGVKLRLDANASLASEELKGWVEFLSEHREQLDYLEQPLAVGEEARMAECMSDTGIPIALDESLNGTKGVQWLEADAWPGPLVIKASLMGDISELCERLRPLAEQVVISSVFETGIGLSNALSLADALPGLSRPVGFDTLNAFEDGLQPIENAPIIRAVDRLGYSVEDLWNLI